MSLIQRFLYSYAKHLVVPRVVSARIEHSMSIRLFPGVLFTLAVGALMPFSAAANTCYWGVGTGPQHYVVNVGALYVPRDAQIGDPIGPIDQPFIQGGGGHSVFCVNDGSARLTFNASSAVAPVPGPIPRRNGMETSGALLQTNIEGVGARITLGTPYDGVTNGYWKLTGPDSSVPFDGYIDFSTPFVLQHSVLRGTVSLVKTGPIGRGMQSLDSGRQLVNGSYTGVPNAFGLALSGSVTQAECTLSANPVSADPVNLGEWPDSEFTGEGHTTDAVPFTIALNSCISDPLPGGTVTNAHIRLDPTAGSATLDAGLGLFSLGSGSTAQGIGIQVLGRDALTPVALETEVLQGAIPATGGMLLEFNARYYQTGPTSTVMAGSADGALGFTITYK
ncbi:fimbrial protein [Pseudomonas sp. T1.Ur]|uniref:fimbrial protein n=1 Tax=Pseudomonas sp. T1.Ur TaxID=2928704 RepID=UPI00201E1AC0|nr:fimbrial protein [Pseudomonas sp. T1.Ur]MCL6703298.1 type 1 fimbrial protein [Pseudomonas sp. T1.Ur]